MIRQVSDLYTQTAEATAKELEDASGLSEAGGENFKVSPLRVPLCKLLSHLWYPVISPTTSWGDTKLQPEQGYSSLPCMLMITVTK